MRKAICVIAIVAALSIPAFAEWRLDLGVIVPRGAGFTAGGETQTIMGDLDVANWPFIPLPEAGIYYEGNAGTLKLGLGARAFTFIVASILWPNAYVELDYERLALQAQVGGGAFAVMTIAGSEGGFGKVLIPDISAWYKIGKNKTFRLGGGIVGLYLPDLVGEGIPFLFYLGGKAAIPL